MDPEDIFEAIRCLNCPESLTKTEVERDDSNPLDCLLERNLEKLNHLLGKNPKYNSLLQKFLHIFGTSAHAAHSAQTNELSGAEDEVPSKEDHTEGLRWRFTSVNLWLLGVLKDSLDAAVSSYRVSAKLDEEAVRPKGGPDRAAPPMSPDTLSFTQQKLILTSVQFIVCLGISPCLLPGVGLPIEMRSEFAKFLSSDMYANSEKSFDKARRLYSITEGLLRCVRQPSLGSVILSRHTGDLLAALCQLRFGPGMQLKPQSHSCQGKGASVTPPNAMNGDSLPEDTESDNAQIQQQVIVMEANSSSKCGTNGTSNAQLEVDALTQEERSSIETQMQRLLENMYQPVIVRELLVLQGGPPPKLHAGKAVLVPSPAWLRQACGHILSERLVQPGGVKNVLHGILGTGQDSGVPNWKKCDAAAKIIAHCPKQSKSKREYYSRVAPQILDLIHTEDQLVAAQFVRVAVSAIALLLSTQPILTDVHLVQPLLQPMLLCLKSQEFPEVESPLVLVEEPTLTAFLNDIHKVCVTGAEPSSAVVGVLAPILHPLFRLYCFASQGVTHLRTLVEDLLLAFLSRSSRAVTLNTLQLFAFGHMDSHTCPDTQVLSPRVAFSPGSCGGLEIILQPTHWQLETLSGDWEQTAIAVVEILMKLKTDAITAEFFILNLKLLTELVSSEVESGGPVDAWETTASVVEGKMLLYAEEEEAQTVCALERNLTILTLLGHMCDDLGHACFKSASHILDFVHVTLERAIKVLATTEDEVFGAFESETMTMALGLLTAVLTEEETKMSDDDRLKSKALLPLLQSVADFHLDPGVQEMATDLRIAIATHGVVQSEQLQASRGQFTAPSNANRALKTPHSEAETQMLDRPNERGSPVKPLVEVLESSLNITEHGNVECNGAVTSHGSRGEQPAKIKAMLHTNIGGSKATDVPTADGDRIDPEGTDVTPEKMTPSSTVDGAFRELRDPMIPVRGHALITLRKLLDAGDREAVDKHELLLQIFRENLDHGDSYIYLSAIQGLAVLADRFPDRLVPLLAEEFVTAQQRDKANAKGRKATELRLKLGEVLVKTTRNLGDMVPKYRDVLLRVFLSGSRDPDHHVRASSLSNLGEICKLLRFSLGNILSEVFECIQALITSDPESDVRKAAAMFVTLLLQGLGPDSTTVLKDNLRDLYRLLKVAQSTERDALVQLHVDMALEELDGIMKQFLFPKQTFSKKISVLDPPAL